MKASEVLQILKISRPTLSHYAQQGKLKFTVLPNGYYDYDETSVYSLIKTKLPSRLNIIYSRVSTYKQKNDLEIQTDSIKLYCKKNNINVDKIIEDVDSGITLDRKGMNELLQLIFDNKVESVIINYKDRISRLSFSTLEQIFKRFNTKIILVHSKKEDKKTVENELLDELFSIVHSFTTRMYSKRRTEKMLALADFIQKEIQLKD
jgi:predicted site-specific integrase-resolvase